MMRKYKFSGAITCSAYTEVEANGLEEAIIIMRGRNAAIADHGVKESEYWIIEGMDGTAHDIVVYNVRSYRLKP